MTFPFAKGGATGADDTRGAAWLGITVGIKPPGSAVSAGSDKMQVVQPVIMPLAFHTGIEAQGPAHRAQYPVEAPPAGLEAYDPINYKVR
jgi:hypothetical protein